MTKRLGLIGAVLGIVIGYATTPSVQALLRDNPNSSFSYWHVLLLHIVIGAIVGALAGILLKRFLLKAK